MRRVSDNIDLGCESESNTSVNTELIVLYWVDVIVDGACTIVRVYEKTKSAMIRIGQGSVWLRRGKSYLSQYRIDSQGGKVCDCRWCSGNGIILCGLMDNRGVLCGCERCPVRFTDRGCLIDGSRGLVPSVV